VKLLRNNSRRTPPKTSKPEKKEHFSHMDSRTLNLAWHWIIFGVFFIWSNNPPMGQGLLIHEVSRTHTTTNHSQ